MTKNKIVYVTGSSGFIASHVVDAFIKEDYIVIGIDHAKNFHNIIDRNYLFFQKDLGDVASLKKLFQKYPPSHIVHQASSLVDVEKSIQQPWKSQEDIINTTKLVETALPFGLQHIVFSSSANIYGTHPKTPTKETDILQPASPYGLTKLAIEEYLKYFSKRNNITCTIFRYFNIFGERQSPYSSACIPTFINNLLKDEPITLRGGDQTRDFIYVKDVANANVLACKKNASLICNIGMGKGQEISTILMLIAQLMKVKPKILQKEKDPADCIASLANIKEAEKYLQWSPKTSFNEGIINTIGYYEKLYRTKMLSQV